LDAPDAPVPYITDPRETCVRWAPLGALPDAPVGEIEVRSLGEQQLSLILRYDPPADFDVRLDFRGTHIVEISAEIASRWQDNQVPLPRIGRGAWAEAAWPLLEVIGSRWLASLPDTRLVPLNRDRYRHFELISRGSQVSVLTCVAPEACLIETGEGWPD
jgi:hypothetical protein